MRLIDWFCGPAPAERVIYKLTLTGPDGEIISTKSLQVYDDLRATEMQVAMKVRELARDALFAESLEKV